MSAPETPPGWVRLTAYDGEDTPFMWPADALEKNWGPYNTDARDTYPSMDERACFFGWGVRETWAEVAVLIAEARRAERRFRELPLMAATVMATVLSDTKGSQKSPLYARSFAADVLDEIERLEANP